MGRGRHPFAGEPIRADARDGQQHAHCVDQGARVAEEVAREENHHEPADRVEHGVRRHLDGRGGGRRRWPLYQSATVLHPTREVRKQMARPTRVTLLVRGWRVSPDPKALEPAAVGRHHSARHRAASHRHPRGEGAPLRPRGQPLKQPGLVSGVVGGHSCELGHLTLLRPRAVRGSSPAQRAAPEKKPGTSLEPFDPAAATLTEESTMNESRL